MKNVLGDDHFSVKFSHSIIHDFEFVEDSKEPLSDLFIIKDCKALNLFSEFGFLGN